MYFRIEEKLNYTIIYNEKIERIFVDDPNEFEIGSILHARVKRVDKNRSFSFIELGGIDGFYNNSDLKAGNDYLFNIRKTPDIEKGYVLDRKLKIEINNSIMYPFSDNFYNNDMEKIVGCPVKSKKFNEETALKLKSIYNSLILQKSQLPIPKIVYKKNRASDNYIINNKETLGNKEGLLKAFSNTPEITERIILLEKGSIIIDTLPHFTFVDFNSNNFNKMYKKELNHLEINKNLLEKSIRILNLRNIEGMILIDLLKMKNYDELISITKEILNNTGFIYHDITKLGLMEITRKKTGRVIINKDIKNTIINLLINL